jgi:hypothetical protein
MYSGQHVANNTRECAKAVKHQHRMESQVICITLPFYPTSGKICPENLKDLTSLDWLNTRSVVANHSSAIIGNRHHDNTNLVSTLSQLATQTAAS